MIKKRELFNVNELPRSQLYIFFDEYSVAKKKIAALESKRMVLQTRMESTVKPLSPAPSHGGGSSRSLEDLACKVVEIDEKLENLKKYALLLLGVLNQAMDQIESPMDRAIFKYRFVEGKTMEEICKVHDDALYIKHGWGRSRLCRSSIYNHLNKVLDGLDFEIDPALYS